MSSEITFVDTYTCPRCQTELETPRGCGSMWLVCPTCGRAALPPEFVPHIARPGPVSQPEILFIGSNHEGGFAPLPPLRPARRPMNVWRVFLLVGLIFCLFGLVEAFLAQSTVRSAVFGFVLLVFVGMMTYPTRTDRQ